MNKEKQKILDRINELIDKKEAELLNRAKVLSNTPNIHNIDDGVVIRFFTNWDDCFNNEEVKYRKILDKGKPEDITVFHFIPKGTILKLEKRDYIQSIICLSGKLKLEVNNETLLIDAFNKTTLKSNEFKGESLEDTYVITSNRV
jgi:hypothetical protein